MQIEDQLDSYDVREFELNVLSQSTFGSPEDLHLALDYDESIIVGLDTLQDFGSYQFLIHNSYSGQFDIDIELCYLDCDYCEQGTITIYISDGPFIDVTISPNGDGINERLVIPMIEDYPCNEITIFNRWGQPVFQKEAYLGEWAGDFMDSGKPVPEATYYFNIDLYSTCVKEDASDGPLTIQGAVTVLR